MAILEDRGVAVSVHVDRRPLPEYEDPERPSLPPVANWNTAIRSNYIESEDDKEFSLCLRTTRVWPEESPDSVCVFTIFVDGRVLIKGHRLFRTGSTSRIFVDGVREIRDKDIAILHRLRFSPITTVDDDNRHRVMKDIGASEELGTIRVEIYRAILVKRYDKLDRYPQGAPRGKKLSFSEKALKGRAISHTTTYSPPVAEALRPRAYRSRYDPISKSPFAIFSFKYRSREALRAEMIIPRAPNYRMYPDYARYVSPVDVPRLEANRPRQAPKRVREEEQGPTARKRDFAEMIDLTTDCAELRVHKIPRHHDYVSIDLTQC